MGDRMGYEEWAKKWSKAVRGARKEFVKKVMGNSWTYNINYYSGADVDYVTIYSSSDNGTITIPAITIRHIIRSIIVTYTLTIHVTFKMNDKSVVYRLFNFDILEDGTLAVCIDNIAKTKLERAFGDKFSGEVIVSLRIEDRSGNEYEIAKLKVLSSLDLKSIREIRIFIKPKVDSVNISVGR